MTDDLKSEIKGIRDLLEIQGETIQSLLDLVDELDVRVTLLEDAMKHVND